MPFKLRKLLRSYHGVNLDPILCFVIVCLKPHTRVCCEKKRNWKAALCCYESLNLPSQQWWFFGLNLNHSLNCRMEKNRQGKTTNPPCISNPSISWRTADNPCLAQRIPEWEVGPHTMHHGWCVRHEVLDTEHRFHAQSQGLRLEN